MPFPVQVASPEGRTVSRSSAVMLDKNTCGVLHLYTDGTFSILIPRILASGVPELWAAAQINSNEMVKFGLITEEERAQWIAEEHAKRDHKRLKELMMQYPVQALEYVTEIETVLRQSDEHTENSG